MSSEEYLRELRLRFSHRLPQDELERVMEYYTDYFRQAGPEGSQRVIAELGSPEELVRRFMNDKPDQPEELVIFRPPRRHGWTVWRIVLVLFLGPILLGLACMLGAVVVGMAVGGVACLAISGVTALSGVLALLTHGVATTMLFIGGGFLMAGAGLLLLTLVAAVARVGGKLLGRMFRGLLPGGEAMG